MTTLDFAQRVDVVRQFTMFCARHLGPQQERALSGPLSRAAARIVAELARRVQVTPARLRTELRLDPAHLSRLLASLRARRLVTREPSPTDRRQSVLSLTRPGRKVAAQLEGEARLAAGAWLRALEEQDQQRLVSAMRTIEALLGPAPAQPRSQSYLLRPPAPGDLGWVVQRHGTVYALELGWDARYETLVAEIAARFFAHHEAARECCWIAERDGERVGSAFLMDQSATVGRIRLLLVDPRARGCGIGTRLVNQCLHFARTAGYQRVTLSTHALQRRRRSLFDGIGFQLVREEWEPGYGQRAIGQTWEVPLTSAADEQR